MTQDCYQDYLPPVAIVVVGKAQPKSKRLHCTRCGALLEYQLDDVRIEGRMRYVDCPIRSCKNSNYLGTE